jgi:hypothetical protein
MHANRILVALVIGLLAAASAIAQTPTASPTTIRPTAPTTPTATPTTVPRSTPSPTPAVWGTGDWFGFAAAACDFDGNGRDDLAVSAPHEDAAAALSNTGVVHVIYSKSTGGLDALLPIENQLWAQGTNGAADTGETEDAFGRALAGGDFNNDGYCDLAVGVTGERIGAASVRSGAVHVFYGSTAGLQASAPNDQLWHLDNIVGPGTVQDREEFGHSLSVADFNGDGFEDLAIGTPWRSLEGTKYVTGSVMILHGAATGLQTSSPAYALVSQDTPGVAGTAHARDRFGWSLATGDFNDDGYGDLAVGAPGERVDVGSAGIDAGFVSILHGGTTGLVGAGTGFGQNTIGIAGGVGPGDEFGWALAAGDFDADGATDLAVSAPGEAVFRAGVMQNAAGQVHILYGQSGSGLGVARTQTFNQDTDGVPGDTNSADRFGDVLAAGNFLNTQNTGDDLVVGVPFEDAGAGTNFGVVHFFYGLSGTGLSAENAEGVDAGGYQSASIHEAAEPNDFFPSALAVGRFDGLHHDLVIGVGAEDFQTPTRPNAGLVHVIHGGPNGLWTHQAQKWSQDSASIKEVAE